jgi:hypothetical protein
MASSLIRPLAADALLDSIPLRHDPLAETVSARPPPALSSRRRLDSVLRSLRTQPAMIDLSELRLGDAGVTELFSALLGHRHLADLRLAAVGSGLALADGAAELVALSLRLRTLVLSRNDLGDEGVCRIARGLRSSRLLERLDLAACSLGDEGASALAATLTSRRIAPLRHLDVSLNTRLGDEGVEALREAAENCRNLTSLNLAGVGAPAPLLAAAQRGARCGREALAERRRALGQWRALGVHAALRARSLSLGPGGAEGIVRGRTSVTLCSVNEVGGERRRLVGGGETSRTTRTPRQVPACGDSRPWWRLREVRTVLVENVYFRNAEPERWREKIPGDEAGGRAPGGRRERGGSARVGRTGRSSPAHFHL